MPTYTYGCKKCGHVFDVFHAMSATPKVECTACGSRRTERHLGTGAGIIFKGGGFYETDFKDKKGKPAKSETAASSGDHGGKASETKADTKAKTKTPAA